MAKSVHDYLDPLADYLLAHGLARASLRPMAAAVGTSDRMLVYHFGSKAELVDRVLAHITKRLLDKLAGRAPTPDVLAAFAGAEFKPFMALWQDVVAGAMRGDAGLARAGAAMVEAFRPWLEANLADPALAPLVLAAVDGAAQLASVGRDRDARAALEALGAVMARGDSLGPSG